MTTQVIFLFGRPGVGKLTVGELLSADTGYRLLHNHAVVDLVISLFSFGSPPFVVLREKLWLDAIDAPVERFKTYRARLGRAAHLATGGDPRYIASPRVDSYHGAWFELHEDLIVLSGRTRAEEVAAGRA
jgi:hypothetical protein